MLAKDGGMRPFIPETHLFHSRKKFVRWCMRRGCSPVMRDSDAQTIFFDGVAAVLLESRDEGVWLNALLVHEAYHIVCSNLEAIGDDGGSSEEVTAYMVQYVAGLLMQAHERWLAKHASE